jgi:hypothetical protein
MSAPAVTKMEIMLASTLEGVFLMQFMRGVDPIKN